MRTFLFALLLFFSQNIFACFAAKIPLEKRVELATNISIGWVVGKELTEFESRLSEPSAPISTYEGHTLVVKLIESIKGHFIQEKVFPKMISCGSGEGDLKQQVIVFYDNEYWYVMPYSAEIVEQLKKIIKQKY